MSDQISHLSTSDVFQRAPSVFATQPHPYKTSSRYEFISTSTVCTDLAGIGWNPVAVTEQRLIGGAAVGRTGNRAYQKHMLRFRKTEGDIPMLGEDHIEMVLITAHDGSCSFTFRVGVFRMVCSNGMVVGTDVIEGLRIRHQGYNAEHALEAVAGIISQAQGLAPRLEAMQNRVMQPVERELFAQQASELRWKPKEGRSTAPVGYAQLLNARREEDAPSTLWNVFNTVQENMIQRGGQMGRNSAGHRMRTQPIRAIDQQVKLNSNLWNLADTYLKAA